MDVPSLLTFLVLHWQYFVPALMTLISTAHSRLARWPVLAVLVKHMAGFPMLKWVAVDIARVVIASWNSEVPELPAQVEVASDKVMGALSSHLTQEEIHVLSGALAGTASLVYPTEVPAPPATPPAPPGQLPTTAPPHPAAKWDPAKGWVVP